MRTIVRALARGMLKRCARCGRGRLFRRWFTMVERYPGCGLRFEREEGYWVGAMIVNIAAAQLAVGVVLVGGFMAFLPHVPILGLTVAAVAAAGLTPLLFYPWSKTIWVALDILMHRMDIQDHQAAGNGHGRGEMVRGPLSPVPDSSWGGFPA